MARKDSLQLETGEVGALPIINRLINRLDLERVLDASLHRPGRQPLVSYAKTILVLVRNLLVGREPLYGLDAWASTWEPSLFGLEKKMRFNDDRVGKALDRLFEISRSTLTLTVVRQAVERFELDLSQLHNDTTTVTLSGAYEDATGFAKNGKPTLIIVWGHNKDHRPDLKQLVLELTVTQDGAVPVFFDAHHGNTSDDQLHRKTWDVAREIAGRSDFLYVADSKLCVRETMAYINQREGRFLTVLPRTRAEDKKFRDFLQSHAVEWEPVWSRPNTRGEGKPADVYRAYVPKAGTSEGYKLVWYHSSEKQLADRRRREDLIHQTHLDLEGLQERLRSKRTRLRSEPAVRREVHEILAKRNSAEWIKVDIEERKEKHFKQATTGRPGPNTRYICTDKRGFVLSWKECTDQIQYEQNSDGIFPLVTNDKDLSPEKMLLAYKTQPRLEKRFEQLKTIYDLMPMWLKSVCRIEAFLHVYFIALLIQTLLERELRKAMKTQGLTSLPLYPEKRVCPAPTANRLFTLFDSLQVSRLFRNGQPHRSFQPRLTKEQKLLLALLKIPDSAYRFE
jgi:transposase